jgi:hypothetical protein
MRAVRDRLDPFGRARHGSATRLSLAFVAVCAIAIAVVLVLSDLGARDDPKALARQFGDHALDERSLIRRDNLRRAMAVLEGELRPGERLVTLFLRPTELSATVGDRRGVGREIDIDLQYAAHTRDTDTDPEAMTMRVDDVRPEAVENIARAALRGARVDDTHLETLQLVAAQPARWSVSVTGVAPVDRDWEADIHGRATLRSGETVKASGLEGRSLVRADNLAQALALLEPLGGKVTTLRLEPERLDVELSQGGHARQVQVDAGQRITADVDGGAPISPVGLAVSEIDPAVVERGYREAAARAGISTGKLDYAVLDVGPSVDGPFARWLLFFQGVPQKVSTWRMGLDGHDLVRNG